MPDTPPIAPALDDEEWANVCVEGECRPDDIWARVRHWHPDPEERTGDDEPDYHAIAALALHQQPFGFDEVDRDRLRQIASELDKRGLPEAWSDRLRDVADRIAALLPRS